MTPQLWPSGWNLILRIWNSSQPKIVRNLYTYLNHFVLIASNLSSVYSSPSCTLSPGPCIVLQPNTHWARDHQNAISSWLHIVPLSRFIARSSCSLSVIVSWVTHADVPELCRLDNVRLWPEVKPVASKDFPSARLCFVPSPPPQQLIQPQEPLGVGMQEAETCCHGVQM